MPIDQDGSAASSGGGALCYASRPGSPDLACDHTFADGYGLAGCCRVELDGSAGPIVFGHPTSADVARFYECP